VIDQKQLREAFLALAGQVPEPYNLVGVTYGGPGGRGEWVASLHRVDDDTWCEGWGDSPIDALVDLRSHMRQEHPEVFGEIS
jgi:hypothetical protein